MTGGGNSKPRQYSCLENPMNSMKRQNDRILKGKDSDAGRDWGQKEKGMIEDEMAGWHH